MARHNTSNGDSGAQHSKAAVQARQAAALKANQQAAAAHAGRGKRSV
jgi:hypothetical protein